MDITGFPQLLEAYRSAPPEFQAKSYWQSYEPALLRSLEEIDLNHIRSGRYPILATTGFNDTVYFYHPNMPFTKRWPLRFVREVLIKDREILPYSLSTRLIQELSYRHCELVGQLAGAKSVDQVEMSTFGGPTDVFDIEGRKYSVQFLSYYIRYCFAHKHLQFGGDEIYVELGTGSGYQVELLKKLYPSMTFLCFDLPAQLFMCESYLQGSLGEDQIVSFKETLNWSDLSAIKPGKVHFLGNWQMPMLQNYSFNIFWNAASFGEMEPDVVRNYLSLVRPGSEYVYLLQARHGKETTGKVHVQKQTAFDDYDAMLEGFQLVEEADAYQAHRKMTQSGGYFEALWKKA